jgi:hypothetical protein
MTNSSDHSLLRWGGLTSVGGALLFLFVFAWVIVLAGPDPDGASAAIERFPEIRFVRTVENGLYLAVLILWVPIYLALARRLRGRSATTALTGGALAILGLGVLAAVALPHAATSRLSDLYHAAGATPQDRATLVVVWQATQGVFDSFLLVGLLLLAVAIILFGLSMRADPAFGKAFAWVSLLLGIAALAAGTVVLIDPLSMVAALGFFALIGFHLAIGWKARRLSKVA